MSKTGREIELWLKDLIRQVLQNPGDRLRESLISGLGIVKMINERVEELRDEAEIYIKHFRVENERLGYMLQEEREKNLQMIEEHKARYKAIRIEMEKENEILKTILKSMENTDMEKSTCVDKQFCSIANTCPFIIEPMKFGGQCVRENCEVRNTGGYTKEI